MESILLNLVPHGSMPTVHVSQYDVGRQIEVRLYDGASPYSLKSGDYCTVSVRKPDGETVTDYATGDVGDTSVILETTEEISDAIGKSTCEIRLINGDKKIGSLNFFMLVEEFIGTLEPLPPPTPPTPPTPSDPPIYVMYAQGQTFNETDTTNYITEVTSV